LSDKVAVLRREHERGKLELSQAVFTFLQGWLIEHIKGADRRYAAFMVERGVS
jgi:hemerythrin